MIIHIIKKSDIDIDCCRNLAKLLCEKYDKLLCRIIDYPGKDILSNSTSDMNISISGTAIDIDNTEFHKDINGDISELDDIIRELHPFIESNWVDTYWAKNENGWWFLDRRHQYDHDVVLRINDKWYYIGEDHYMKTGWKHVIVDDKPTCLFFSEEDGSLDIDHSKADMPTPDPKSRVIVKWW